MTTKPISSNIAESTEEVRELFRNAVLAREKAHCIYSGHKVGAAIRTNTGKIFSGCNVENSSYGGCICAERTAIVKAVSEVGFLEISDVLVVTDSRDPWPPCGMCLQVIGEFGKNPNIYFANVKGNFSLKKFIEIFSNPFRRGFLSSK